MAVPLFMPKEEWIYRFVYQRGQLSVGEPLYRTVRPGHARPKAEFNEDGISGLNDEEMGTLSVQRGMNSAMAARGVAEDMLTRGLEEGLDLQEVRTYMRGGLDLVRDMQFFLNAAANKTE